MHDIEAGPGRPRARKASARSPARGIDLPVGGVDAAPARLHRPTLSLSLVVPLSLVIVVALVIGIGAYALREIILANFERLEVSAATLDLERFIDGVQHEVDDLRSALTRSAHPGTEAGLAWGGATADSPAGGDILAELRLTVACAYGPDGLVVGAAGRDRAGHRLADDDAMRQCGMPPGHPLLHLIKGEADFAGLYDGEGGPFMLIGLSLPVGDSMSGGKIRLLAGRPFDAGEIQRVSERQHILIDFWSMRSPDLKVLDAAAGAAVSLGAAFAVNSRDENVLQVYRAIEDVFGQPSFLARANIHRDLREIGARTTALAVAAMIALGVAAILMSIVLVRYLMVQPLSRLTNVILGIRRAGDTGFRLKFRRRDEIGLLAREFGSLLDDLADTTRRLADASYRAGRAEMAEGVLHNVGNALNSLSVSAHAVLEHVDPRPFGRLQTAASELADGDVSAERRQKLVEYLHLGLAEARGRLNSLIDVSGRMIENVNRIERILESQRRFDHREKVAEVIPIRPLVSEAMGLVADTYRREVDILLDESLSNVAPVLGQRPIILQIFANLLANAAESIDRARGSGRSGMIEISASPTRVGGRPMIDIQVRDNGVGLSDGDTVRIFQRHHSTKSESGHGIGLHWSAGVVASMQGHLRAESEGLGRGACLHLMLPTGVEEASA